MVRLFLGGSRMRFYDPKIRPSGREEKKVLAAIEALLDEKGTVDEDFATLWKLCKKQVRQKEAKKGTSPKPIHWMVDQDLRCATS